MIRFIIYVFFILICSMAIGCISVTTGLDKTEYYIKYTVYVICGIIIHFGWESWCKYIK